MTDRTDKTYAGVWYAQVTYPSKDDSGEDVTENRMEAVQKGRDIVLTSIPNDEGSHMVIRLSTDDNIATGTWHETTSPSGDFGGAMYSGAGQMVIHEDEQLMEGQWAGVGYDRKQNKSYVYTGRWKLSRVEA